MTLITFDNGKPVFRNGKVGTAQECCCNDCLCCSCVSQVFYYPSVPGANAQPFAGIPPAGGAWQWHSNGYYYGEFPCHYVEYAFSQYASQIFPNAANAGADVAYSGGGTWQRLVVPNPFGSPYGETRCTGSTEANCHPCLVYPGDSPPGDPLPTLDQLQQQCGIYHPCTPCNNCATSDGCGVPGINLSQSSNVLHPDGIPWPPPPGTCPCSPCSILCLEQVYFMSTSKPHTIFVDGVHYFVSGISGGALPITEALVLEADQTASTWVVGVAGGWLCKHELSSPELVSPPYAPGLDRCCDCFEWNWPTLGGDNEGKATEESGWWDQEYTFRYWYYRIRVVPECGACGDYVITPASMCAVPPFFGGPGDEYADAIRCGGLAQINEVVYFPHTFNWAPGYYCSPPASCGYPCWDYLGSTEGNPFP